MLKSLKEKYYLWRVKRALNMLRAVDNWMLSAGYTRQRRRGFWREFGNKEGFREALYNKLESGV